MDNKKTIIGICTFAGSDILRIVQAIQHTLLHYAIVSRQCSAEELCPEQIREFVLSNTSPFAIIHSITSIQQIEALEKEFEDQTFEVIGIQVPREDCFEFLQKNGKVGKQETRLEWYAKFDNDPSQKEMLACFNMLATQEGRVFRCDDGCFNKRIGEVIDHLLLDYNFPAIA